MAGSVDDRLAALRSAIEAEQWDAFAEHIRSWASEQPQNPWLQAGLVVAAAVNGQDTSGARPALEKLDARLGDQVALLANMHAGDRKEARSRIAREIAYGNRSPALIGAFRWAEPGLAEPVKYLFAAPHIVAGCVLQNGETVAMASKGSRMSADSLGHRTDQMWSEVGRLRERVDIGIVGSIEVLGEDGGWVLASTGGEQPRMASVLVAASSGVGEASARAHAVIAALEAEHD